MKALLQRVRKAHVTVAGVEISRIESGLLIFLGVMQGDTSREVAELVDKAVQLRIFSDPQGKMNLALHEMGGEALVVSQFTLCADTSKGRRPSFTDAAAPDVAKALYEEFVVSLRGKCKKVVTGEFAADMQVHLINDGPVTFLLETD